MAIDGKKTGILWFRKDLRLHDNESLVFAAEQTDNLIPVYVFDHRLFEETTSYGFPKINVHRKQFLIESVLDLRESLRERGSDLIIRYGKTEKIIFELSRRYKASWVICNRERTEEEVIVQNSLEKKIWKIGAEMLYFRGKMLYYTSDLPFPITHTPDTFSQFKKEVYKIVPIRDPLEIPEEINTRIGSVDPGEIPDELQRSQYQIDDRAIHNWKGGESVALKHLKKVEDFLETQETVVENAFERYQTTHLSPWVSMGCLSVKLLYKTVIKFAEAKQENYEAEKIISHLLYRDFCRFMAKKYKNKIFRLSGIEGEDYPHEFIDEDIAKAFRRGETGIPLIDAHVRDLNNTGYLTTKSRRNLASFFIYDLKQPWLYGAEMFESMLLDYDPTSNYGNWGIIADTYPETTGKAYVNIVHQAERYDPNGEYVKKWIPELSSVDEEVIHYPWKWTDEQRNEWNLPKSIYPEPLVKPKYSYV